MPSERLLIIDDEPGIRELLTLLFMASGYAVRDAATGEEGLVVYDTWQPDLVITDLNMPGIDGIELLQEIKVRAANDRRDVPVIVLTAYGSTSTSIRAMKEGAFDYVAKPFHNDELKILVRKALDMRRLEADNARLRAELGSKYQFGQFVGSSTKMKEVYDLIKRVMGTKINTFVYGESGTGKELVARAIHYGSERANGPFVAVNCGAIAESLFESELFGYRRGAFTGANRDKAGMFEAADGGTLFLDEIGEMPLGSQVKVLRALQERKVTPVGATQELAVDVRIVAATNRDLRAEVRAGRFREDLYYRLNVVQIDVPPLRERREDIPTLVEHFIQRFGEELGKPIRGTTREALRLLGDYRYPGNVRELQNIIERAVALEQGPMITPASLPERVQGEFARMPAATNDEEFPAEGVDLEARVNALERRYLEQALVAANGNRTQAARLLGITFRSLRYRLVKFGMESGDATDGGNA